MKLLLVMLATIGFGLLGTAHAQPLKDVSATLIEFEDSFASVQLEWNHDDIVYNYKIGCVSCIPNLSENTINDRIVLHNVTSMQNGHALLYVIAYDNHDEIITAKQVLLKLH